MEMLSNSKLGFGLMRLPKDEEGKIKVDEVSKLVDMYMASGLNYFDTAYAYAGSEEAIREALVKRYPRDSFTLANKLPAWKITCQEDVEKIFNESLERCGVEYFDFYLIHSVETAHYDTYKKYGCFEFVKRMKAEGKIKHIGFSFHDTSEFLDMVLTEHPEMEFVQLQLNYLDWNNGVIQSRKNLEMARKHNKPVIVMEPVKGGTLAKLSDEAEAVYRKAAPERSMASWALQFMNSQEGVMTILSGMNSEEQMKDNINTILNLGKMNQEEEALVDQVRKIILSAPTIPCTSCSYCTTGCPMQIQIPHAFIAYNNRLLYGDSNRYKTYYNNHCVEPHHLASACLECGQCESVCPQHLPIISNLKKVAEMFENK